MLRFEIAEPNQQGTCSATLINFWVWIWLLKTPCLVGCFLLVIFSKKKRRAWSPSSDSFMFSGSLLLKREIIFIYHHWLNALLHYWLPFLMKKQSWTLAVVQQTTAMGSYAMQSSLDPCPLSCSRADCAGDAESLLNVLGPGTKAITAPHICSVKMLNFKFKVRRPLL